MTAPAPVQVPKTSAWSMYRAIVGIGAACALIIVSVYQATASRIADNQQRFLQAAIARVLPAATATVAIGLSANGGLERSGDSQSASVFLGFDPDNRLVGAVIAAEGMGYQDKIRVLYAYSFELDAIVGLEVLDSKETPGLGDRVETEPHFIANFRQLDATLNEGGDGLLHPLQTVKQGEKQHPWQIDGITGATITSQAIGDLLHDSASRWVPLLERESVVLAASLGSEEI